METVPVTIKRVRMPVLLAPAPLPGAGAAAAWLIGRRSQRSGWFWSKKAGDMPPIGNEQKTDWKNGCLAVIAVPKEIVENDLDDLVCVLVPSSMRRADACLG